MVFLERDKERGFNTVAYHWPTDELMAIRLRDYSVLIYIYDNEGISDTDIEKMTNNLKINKLDLDGILSVLVSKGILETV